MVDLILEKKVTPELLILTLNRPEKRNALNVELLEQLLDKISKAHQDNELRVMILQGAGSTFCAGMDLNDAADHEKIEKSAHLLTQLFSQLYTSHLVTIAAVHGSAIAGGAGLMAVCDLAIAAQETTFAFPETRRGLIASLVMAFLHRQLREKDFKELLLFGETIDVHKALQIGLINRVVPLSLLAEEALLAAKSALKGAPAATCNTKKLIEKLYLSNFEEDLNKAAAFHTLARASEEAKEGVLAFKEKRDPYWVQS